MNCQDIARILDEQEVESLLTEELSDVQAHLGTCRDCARDWQIHAQLSGAAIPAVPSELRALYPAQVAGVADAAAQRRSRFVIIGTLIAVGAAAAMLAVQLTGSMKPVVSDGDSLHPESGVALAQSISASPVIEEKMGQPPAGAEHSLVVTSVSKTGLRVLLMPPRLESGVVTDKPAVEAFHASLLQALRRISDVTVEMAGGENPDSTAIRFTVISPRFSTLTSGERMYHSSNGRGTWSVGSATLPAIEVVAESAAPQAGTGGLASNGSLPGVNTFSVKTNIDSSGVPTGEVCSGSSINLRRTPSPPTNSWANLCSSVDRIAASLVELLRQAQEPPATNTAQFSAQLRDTSLQANDRQTAFRELLNVSRQSGIPLGAGDIEPISAYVRELPADTRVPALRSLRGMKQSILIPLLLESLQQEANEKVRLEALSTLVVDYVDDSRVRGAQEAVARQDSSRLVRMAAARPLSGDAQWQSYVTEMLANKGLPVTERLAPAIYGLGSPTDPVAVRQANSFLASGRITNQLLDLFQEMKAEVRAGQENRWSTRTQEEAMGSILTLLSSTNAAAAFELQVGYLQDPLQNSSISMLILLNTATRRDDPRVSRALDNIAAGKAGTEMRNMLERTLASQPPF